MTSEKLKAKLNEASQESKWNWKRIKKVLGHIGLLITITLYTAAGAKIFQELEHPAEIIRLSHLQQSLLHQRRRMVVSLNKSRSHYDFGELIYIELSNYETVLAEACKGGLELPVTEDQDITSRWNFLQSAFFASTVVTTIGYGNTVPVTFWGRLFCILFGLIGIPLTLSVIAEMGVLLATALSALHNKLKLYFPEKKIVSTNINFVEHRWLYALGAVVCLILYLAAGAAVFMIWEEDWGFFEGFYFCFITMTTIGFGDLVPTRPNYMLICMFYILVGLALTSTIIELVRRQYAQSWRRLQALTGPLAESLRRLGEFSGSGIDVTMLQNDLRKMLTVVSVAKRSNDGMQQKEWEEAMDCVLRDIGLPAVNKSKPPVIQIVIYETSV